VHPKFDTGAAENLWRAACGPRAALWPPLIYGIGNSSKSFSLQTVACMGSFEFETPEFNLRKILLFDTS